MAVDVQEGMDTPLSHSSWEPGELATEGKQYENSNQNQIRGWLALCKYTNLRWYTLQWRDVNPAATRLADPGADLTGTPPHHLSSPGLPLCAVQRLHLVLGHLDRDSNLLPSSPTKAYSRNLPMVLQSQLPLRLYSLTSYAVWPCIQLFPHIPP